MLAKTRAIILHCIKYSETSVIAYCYTREYGRLSLIIQGVRKKNAKIKFNLLQPLQVNEIDFYYKEKHGLMRLKELKSCHLSDNILFDTNKSAVAIFLAEVFYKTLKEEVKNVEQFHFIEENINHLDGLADHYVNFYLKFLLNFSLYLGFFPNTENMDDASFFDLKNGVFSPIKPMHEFHLSGNLLSTFKNLIYEDDNNLDEAKIPDKIRNELLDAILDYYMLHLEGVTGFKSLTVLRELFHG